MIIVWGSKTSRAAKEKIMDTVFFDMDGTLIDTEKYYNVCWCEAIAKFGYTITKEEALDLRSLGDRKSTRLNSSHRT